MCQILRFKAQSQNNKEKRFYVASIFLYQNDNPVKLSVFSASNRQIGLVSLVEIPYCAETAVSIYWESHRLIITLRPRRGKLVINDLGWKGGRKSAKHLDCALCLPSYAALCLSPWRIDLTQWKRRAFFSRYSCLSLRSKFEIFYSK